MSCEGAYHILCENGHLTIEDPIGFFEEKDNHLWECSKCLGKMAWSNLVDLTNGSWDDDGNRIDGYVELEIDHRETCEHCGAVKETIYKIPQKTEKENKTKRIMFLEKEIALHRYNYYCEKPTISDEEYDRLVRERESYY